MKMTFTHKGWLMGFCPVVFSSPEDGEQSILFIGNFNHILGYIAEGLAWLFFFREVPVLFISELTEPMEVECDDDDDSIAF